METTHQPTTNNEAADLLGSLIELDDLVAVENAIQNLSERDITEETTDDFWLLVWAETQR